MTHIVVLDGRTLNPGDNPWAPLEQFGTVVVHDRTSPEEVIARARLADMLVSNKCPITAQAIEQLPNLKFIAVTATGFNVIDAAAARKRDIPVSNVPVYGTATVAQFTWALILELCHHVGRHGESVASGDWAKSADFCYWNTAQIELAGKRLGLIGYGRIARQVGSIGAAFGMRIAAAGRPDSKPPATAVAAAVQWLSTEALFANSDVVSLHCPLTAETERMVNRALLGRMQHDAFLINTSRGGLVDDHALAEALRAGQLAVAGRGVHVQIAAEVGELDQRWQFSRIGPFELVPRFANLWREEWQAEHIINVFLGAAGDVIRGVESFVANRL